MPKSSVSRSLARLEAVVGTALVERSNRHLRLTEAGALLAAGELVRVLPATRPDTTEVNALYPSHRSLSAKVRVFIDALAAHLGGKKPR